jgi:hypothetical protein
MGCSAISIVNAIGVSWVNTYWIIRDFAGLATGREAGLLPTDWLFQRPCIILTLVRRVFPRLASNLCSTRRVVWFSWVISHV